MLVHAVDRHHSGPSGASHARAWRDRVAPNLVGEDANFVAALEMLERAAVADCDVLITGPSGTGKELAAHALHTGGHRALNPFVALNCAALPKDLVESEIFGCVKGAFTGAIESRPGRFLLANTGTLFLDELGELDFSLQGKFLRVVQEREFTPVGASKAHRVDVRIVSATNQDLYSRCREREFRDDLLYRLDVVRIEMPALVDRPTDIPLLAHHYLERANARHGRSNTGFTDEAMSVLRSYSWPGNIREMRNCIERAVVLKREPGPIAVSDFSVHIVDDRGPHEVGKNIVLPARGLDINDTLAEVETRLTIEALRRARGNRAKAADLLGLKRTTLVERLKKLKIQETDFSELPPT